MPSRRYYITTAPVAHINGKMAPVEIRCSNSYDPESETPVSFWYGYRRNIAPNTSRFAIRSNRRNLTSNPYTDDEQDNRDLFTNSLNAVYTNMRIGTRKMLCVLDFNRQSKYTSLYGYAIAETRANGGVWPARWRRLL